MMTTAHEPIAFAETTFTVEQARALEALRSRFREDHDLFTRRELARLRFLRWLVRTARFIP